MALWKNIIKGKKRTDGKRPFTTEVDARYDVVKCNNSTTGEEETYVHFSNVPKGKTFDYRPSQCVDVNKETAKELIKILDDVFNKNKGIYFDNRMSKGMKIGLSDAAEYVRKFNDNLGFDPYFKRLFYPFKLDVLCKVICVDADVMKKFERKYDNTKVIGSILDKILTIIAMIYELDSVDRIYKELGNDLEKTMSILENGNNPMDAYNLFYHEYEFKYNDIDLEIMEELESLISELGLIPMNITNLLGVYCPIEDVIYLCIENILNLAEELLGVAREPKLGAELTESVIVHEYVHYLHYHSCNVISKANAKDYEITAVEETIAETIQKIYINEKCGSQCLNEWIDSHSECGLFPGWPYAGQKILNERAGWNFKEKRLVNKLIKLSLNSFKEAYDVLETMNV